MDLNVITFFFALPPCCWLAVRILASTVRRWLRLSQLGGRGILGWVKPTLLQPAFPPAREPTDSWESRGALALALALAVGVSVIILRILIHCNTTLSRRLCSASCIHRISGPGHIRPTPSLLYVNATRPKLGGGDGDGDGDRREPRPMTFMRLVVGLNHLARDSAGLPMPS